MCLHSELVSNMSKLSTVLANCTETNSCLFFGINVIYSKTTDIVSILNECVCVCVFHFFYKPLDMVKFDKNDQNVQTSISGIVQYFHIFPVGVP